MVSSDLNRPKKLMAPAKINAIHRLAKTGDQYFL